MSPQGRDFGESATEGEVSIDPTVLETIGFDYRGSTTEVVYSTEEFTFVCPWTGLPDFGTLEVTYVPRENLVELKSLKYYLTSFRNVGILQEHVVNRVLNDLVALIQPVWLEVALYCKERGGIKTEVYASYPPESGAIPG
jgi:7-cyano-7-deazaguanine reductase